MAVFRIEKTRDYTVMSTMPLWFWRTMDSMPTSSWNLTSGKEAADEALFSGTGNHSPL